MIMHQSIVTTTARSGGVPGIKGEMCRDFTCPMSPQSECGIVFAPKIEGNTAVAFGVGVSGHLAGILPQVCWTKSPRYSPDMGGSGYN